MESTTRWSRRGARRIAALLAVPAYSVALVTAQGVSAATGAPPVIWGEKAGPVAVRGATLGTVAALPLPSGDWWITAKGVLEGVGGTPGQHLGVTCRLAAGAHEDAIGAAPVPGGADGSRVPFLLTVAHHFGAPGKARLRCVGEGVTGAVVMRDIRITAVRAGRLTVQQVGGPTTTTGSGRPRVISQLSSYTLNVPGDNLHHNIAGLALPAGSWWIVAKAALSASTVHTYECRLAADGDFDIVRSGVSGAGSPWDAVPVAAQVVHTFGSPGSVTLACKGGFDFSATWVTLTAVKAGRLTNRSLESGSQTTVGSGEPRVVSGYADGPRAIPTGGSYQTIRSLTLPPGRWSASATLWVDAAIPSLAVVRQVTCRLSAGADTDESRLRLQNNVTAVAPMMLQVTRTSTSPTSVRLQCKRSGTGGTIAVRFLKITAVKAASLGERPI